MQSIAVIGAGMAGLSCAQRLHSAGLPVQVFEKGRGPGGRLSSKRMDGFSIDMGAPYFEVRSPRFRATVEGWHQSGWLEPWETAPTFLQLQASDQPSPAGDRAAIYAVGTPRMSAIARNLADGLRLHTQVRIVSLEREADVWRLEDTQGERHGPFDRVILAAPAPQTLALLAAHSPRLTALAQRDMHCRFVVLLHFSRASLRVAPLYQFADSPLALACCDSAKPRRTTPGQAWTLYADPAWSGQHADADPNWVQEQLVTAFLQQVPVLPADALIARHCHRWLYSQPQPVLPAAGATDLAAWDDGLGICGDWMSTGDVEGAWLSGIAAAETLLTQNAASHG